MKTQITEAADDAIALARQAASPENIAELDRRWKSFKGQTSTTSKGQACVGQTRGTPTFRKWRDRKLRA
jgi:hypothetical protein